MKATAQLLAFVAATCAAAFSPAPAEAEQVERFGDWEVHYVVVPSTFLTPEIAAAYQIVRAKDRSFINVSVLGPSGEPKQVRITGRQTNLLGQSQQLAFREVNEGVAYYYLAEIKHGKEEVVRFKINIERADGAEMPLEFQQKLYWDEP